MNYTSVSVITGIIVLIASCQPRVSGTAREVNHGDSISFIVIGDWGVGGSSMQKNVADQIDEVSQRNNVQFIITTGDNFYPSGVNSVTDGHWQRSFEKVYNKQGHMVPWYPTLGNHDYNGSPAAQVQYSSISNRWRLTATYYSFVKNVGGASVLFAFADMNPFVKGYYNHKMPELKLQDTATQYKWLQETLNKKTDWKIVVGHQPLYSAGSHGSSSELINRFKPLLLNTGTDFYIAGHDHNLQYLKLQEEPIHYLISGGGGRGLYDTRNKDKNTQFSESTHGFLLMTIFADRAMLYFYDTSGNVIYKNQVSRR